MFKKDEGESDSNSVNSHGLTESIDFNKLSLLSEKGVGAPDYVSLHLQTLSCTSGGVT